MRVVNQQVPTPFRDIDLGQLLRPNLVEFAKQGRADAAALLQVARAARAAARVDQRRWTSRSASPRACRPACTRARASSSTCARCSPTPTAPTTSGCSRTSSTSPRPTSTPASGSSSAPTAGTTSRSPRPCARRRRCRWSTSPSKVRDRELIDGGIVSTTNLDIAVEAGAKFVVVVNPLVPVRQRLHQTGVDACSARGRATSATWASRRSATRSSSCWPTSACTRWPSSGRSATRASTSC